MEYLDPCDLDEDLRETTQYVLMVKEATISTEEHSKMEGDTDMVVKREHTNDGTVSGYTNVPEQCDGTYTSSDQHQNTITSDSRPDDTNNSKVVTNINEYMMECVKCENDGNVTIDPIQQTNAFAIIGNKSVVQHRAETRVLSDKSRSSKKRIHACTICGKTYNKVSSLNRHKVSHTGETPYVCTICNKGYQRTDHLHRHMKSHESKPSKGLDMSHDVGCNEDKQDVANGYPKKIHKTLQKTAKDQNTITSDSRPDDKNNLKVVTNVNECVMECVNQECDNDGNVTIDPIQQTNALAIIGNKSVVQHRAETRVLSDKSRSSKKRIHACTICGKTYNKVSSLNRHKVSHTGETPYVCTICDKGYQRTDHLHRHMKSHESKPSKDLDMSHDVGCNEDKQDVANGYPKKIHKTLQKTAKHQNTITSDSRPDDIIEQKLILNHKVEDAEDKPVVKSEDQYTFINNSFKVEEDYNVCGSDIASDSSSTHMKHCCSTCNQTFKSETVLKRHETMCTGDCLCPVCDEPCINFVARRKHMMLVHMKDDMYYCSKCDNAFKTYRILLRHAELHSGEKRHSCSVCGQRFRASATLRQHELRHSGKKNYCCSVCGKSFTQYTGLMRHEKTHTGNKPFACLTCGKRYSQSTMLKIHKLSHTGDKPFICSVCGKRFPQTHRLRVHMRTHTGEKPYSCSRCDKTFAQCSGLRSHMFFHTGEKPYPCKVCAKKFRTDLQLQKHSRTHTGEKPYKCTVCGKAFTGCLKRHMLTHTKQRPFVCSVCGMGLTQASSLKRHMLTHSKK